MTGFLEDLDVGDEGMEWLEGMGGDIDKDSQGEEYYDKVGQEVGGVEGAEDDEELSGSEYTASGDEKLFGLE